jgi:multidrug efflux pump subunit AcrB
MVKALNERPQLKIEVPIGWIGDLDRPALVEAKLSTQVREAQSGTGNRKQSPADAPEFEQLDPAAKVEFLTRLYAKNVGGEPKFPQEITSLKTKAESLAAKADLLKQALREHITVTDSDLVTLGQQRAIAVQQALLRDGEVDPARVFLAVNDEAKKQDGKVRLELSLK